MRKLIPIALVLALASCSSPSAPERCVTQTVLIHYVYQPQIVYVDTITVCYRS